MHAFFMRHSGLLDLTSPDVPKIGIWGSNLASGKMLD